MTTPRLPAEWEPQSGIMLTWPHERGGWGARLHAVEPVFVRIAHAVSRRQRLLISCRTAEHRRAVLKQLREGGVELDAVRLALCPSNNVWARDHGPITVERGGRARLLDFRFNGWGMKYPADLDNAISRALAAEGCFGATPLETLPFVLEGGSIDSDGEGTLLTTSRCLFHEKRNPELTRADWERSFGHWFGVTRVLWLDDGELLGDDTDGHVDMLARFAGNATILYQGCSEPDYPAKPSLDRMVETLRGFKTRSGHPYNLSALPWPSAKFSAGGERLPASYANFLVINEAVLVPVYGDAADDPACAIIGDAFPGRAVVPINALPLIVQHGSLHCVTMQFPASVALPAAPIPGAD